MSDPLLRVRDLRVAFPEAGRQVEAVSGVSFDVFRGEVVGLVGESGSGKTLSALSCMRLVPQPGRVTAAELAFDGIDMLAAGEGELRRMRGERIGLVPQDPLTSLHGSIRVGRQIAHALRDHGVPRGAVGGRVVEALRDVGLPTPEVQARRFTHELSGGMRQRALLGLALANQPDLLIADEPTTAVDATVQAQLLRLLARLRAERHMSVLFVTHNLGIVADLCDRVLVMYAGRIVEDGPTREVFTAPQHPYTQALLAAVPSLEDRGFRAIPGSPPGPWARPSGCPFHPRCAHAQEACTTVLPALTQREERRRAACLVSERTGTLAPLARDGARLPRAVELAGRAPGETVFQVRDVVRHFRSGQLGRRQTVQALRGITLDIRAGESLGIVGESGSGKSTLLRQFALLDRPTSGTVAFGGTDLGRLRGNELADFRRQVQIVFQDPYASLDPRYTVAESIREALRHHGSCSRAEEPARVRELLERVGLAARFAGRQPREMSGGQRQRVSIARALATRPRILLADEPVSALDVSIQSQIIELFRDLEREEGLTLVVVSHDLAVVREMTDRVVTMYLGTLVEDAPAEEYAVRPRHPYSYVLAHAAVRLDRFGSTGTELAAGEAPSPMDPPSGCPFHTRCFNAAPECAAQRPPLQEIAAGHRLACLHPVQGAGPLGEPGGAMTTIERPPSGPGRI
jgi:peptide/nickel transport system ATP-binding protein